MVAAGLLALVDCFQVTRLKWTGDGQVADRMIVERLAVLLPHVDAAAHHRAHGRLKIEVADNAAGDTRGTGARSGFVQHQYVLTRTSPAGF